MLSDELLRKVRRIEITTRKVVDDVLTGNYRSHFKGQGVQFSEHRVYNAGDDVRHIDWKASARTRDPLLKKFDEEREMNVFLIVDLSGSETFGSSNKLKSEVLAEIGGMLAYAATHTGDRVGALIFAGEVEHIVPPKKGRQHVLRLIRDLLGHQSTSRGTDLAGALKAADRIMKHRGIVFLLSDFIAKDYEISLNRLAQKHDVVGIRIADERELEIPDIGQILLFDPESGEERLVDTSSSSFKTWFQKDRFQEKEILDKLVRKGRLEILEVLTKEDYGEAVVRFFRARARRKKK